jgi:hypothetical protein
MVNSEQSRMTKKCQNFDGLGSGCCKKLRDNSSRVKHTMDSGQ